MSNRYIVYSKCSLLLEWLFALMSQHVLLQDEFLLRRHPFHLFVPHPQKPNVSVSYSEFNFGSSWSPSYLLISPIHWIVQVSMVFLCMCLTPLFEIWVSQFLCASVSSHVQKEQNWEWGRYVECQSTPDSSWSQSTLCKYLLFKCLINDNEISFIVLLQSHGVSKPCGLIF